MKIQFSIFLFIAFTSNTFARNIASLMPTHHNKLSHLAPSTQQVKLNHIQEEKVEDSDVFHKPTLFWYHKFASQNGAHGSHHTKNPGYESEEELRMKRDANLDRIDSLARKESYTKRDIEHRILALKNTIDKDRASLHTQMLMATQRTTAMKFEINHDIMWKAYYAQRLKQNGVNLGHSDSRTAPAIKTLMKNDKSRMKFYEEHAKEQWHALKRMEGKNNVLNSTISKPLRKMIAKISLLRLKGEKEIRKLQGEIRRVREANVPIEAAIKRDERADFMKRDVSKSRGKRVDSELSSLVGGGKKLGVKNVGHKMLGEGEVLNYWE